MIQFVVGRYQSQWVLARKVGHCPTFFVGYVKFFEVFFSEFRTGETRRELIVRRSDVVSKGRK